VIIQCEKCKTRYNFDESLITGTGIKVRCTRCQHVFFQKNPSAEVPPPSDRAEPEETPAEEQVIPTEEQETPVEEHLTPAEEQETPAEEQEIPAEEQETPAEEKKGVEDLAKTLKELGVETDDHAPDRWEAETIVTDNGENDGGDISSAVKPRKKKSRILSRVIVYLLLIILMGGVYFWFFPRERQKVVDMIGTYVPIETPFGTKKTRDIEVVKEAIAFVDVKERIVKNWIIGDILLIEGAAVNNNTFTVKQIQVKGKILDTAGTVLAEQTSYCNNILTDEELRNFTEKEIYRELGNPSGRNLANESIPHEGTAPFMIAFTNPSKEAGEFIVELADIKTVDE